MKTIIKAPLVTEKNTFHSAAGVYVFDVEVSSSKSEIRKAVETSFGVKVDSIRTMVGRGQRKMTKQGPSKLKYQKKALVKLKDGQKIALFEGA